MFWTTRAMLYPISIQFIKCDGRGAAPDVLPALSIWWERLMQVLLLLAEKFTEILPECSLQNYPDGITWTIQIFTRPFRIFFLSQSNTKGCLMLCFTVSHNSVIWQTKIFVIQHICGQPIKCSFLIPDGKLLCNLISFMFHQLFFSFQFFVLFFFFLFFV